MRSPEVLPVPSALFVGGGMKLYLALGAVLAVAAVIFAVVQVRRSETAPREVAATVQVPPRPPEPSPPAVPVKSAEEALAVAPPAEETKAPLASIAGTVRDRAGAPVPFTEVVVAFHPLEEDRLAGSRLSPEWLRGSRCLSAYAAEDGAYLLEKISFSGKATISAFQDGFAGSVKSIDVEAGENLEGIDLELAPGKVLRGILLGREGGPVKDALVSVYQAWNSQDLARGGNLAATDAGGRFVLGLSEKAESCDLRANSESEGQDFFLQVTVTADEVRLEMKERAMLRGRVQGDDGIPVTNVRVVLGAEVPEPSIPIWYSGWRPRHRVEAVPDAGADTRPAASSQASSMMRL